MPESSIQIRVDYPCSNWLALWQRGDWKIRSGSNSLNGLYAPKGANIVGQQGHAAPY
jgi:hypothetical protein